MRRRLSYVSSSVFGSLQSRLRLAILSLLFRNPSFVCVSPAGRCGHCKALKPDWDKLIADFEGSATQLVADVDCTAGGEPLCNDHGIQGFPTLKVRADVGSRPILRRRSTGVR